MIWVVLAFFAGGMVGFLTMALLASASEDRRYPQQWAQTGLTGYMQAGERIAPIIEAKLSDGRMWVSASFDGEFPPQSVLLKLFGPDMVPVFEAQEFTDLPYAGPHDLMTVTWEMRMGGVRR